MDLTSIVKLTNSISRFNHLVTCCMSKTMPAEKDYRSISSFLKHLKPVLDDVANYKENLDEALCKECEELDLGINEARVFLEKWSPKMSKILCVLESRPLFTRIKISSAELSCLLRGLSESQPATLSLSRALFCIQESQNMNVGELCSRIEEISNSQKEGKSPGSRQLMAIIESLSMNMKQALLSEFIALEKERQRAEGNRTNKDLEQISVAVDLINHIRHCFVVKIEDVLTINNVQIPPYFLCPLSFELMLDPVIVSSGQTFERYAIQKWMDHGLETCPKTRVQLSHKNLIPNYTVKALVASWCSENKSDLSKNPLDAVSVERHTSHEADHQDPRERRETTSRSSFEIRHGFEKQKVDVSPEEAEKLDQSSAEHSYTHSRSESASSAISSIDYLPVASSEISRLSNRKDGVNDRPEDMASYPLSFSVSSKLSGESLLTKSANGMAANRKHNPFRTLSISSESVSDDLTSTSHVEKLIKDLKSESTDLQTAAAGELRFLAKYNVENRFIIVRCQAIDPLISLLHSDVKLAQEHAVTALLNLSINDNLKAKIAEGGALDPLIHVLRTGNVGAKENAAAALFSLSLLDDYRIKIGRSNAVKALVDLLGSGTVRGKKDAATALFNLSIFHENKTRIIQAGAVKHLVVMMNPLTEMVDKAVALLANLSTITEGCSAIAREGGIPLLVDIVDTGSQRGKENASSVLMQLCVNSPKYCRNILQEGAIPPLVALTQSGTPRAKEKAQQLLSHFRNQREKTVARAQS